MTSRLHPARPIAAAAAVVALAVALVVVSLGRPATVRGTASLPNIELTADANRPAVRLAQPAAVPGGLPFPINPLPRCYVLNNYGDVRPGNKIHVGEDIVASLGQEIYAVADGVLNKQTLASDASANLSGNSWHLAVTGGPAYYFYAHLSKFADGLTVGSVVRRGDVIGYVGDTGDPGPGNYHLHFEVHPAGDSNTVDPLPLLAVPSSCTIYRL